MNRLIAIIGPAPSEITWDDAMLRLREERCRVRKELELFKIRTTTSKKPRARKVTTKNMKALTEETGLSSEDMLTLLKAKIANKEKK